MLMASIVFYDATQTDTSHLTDGLNDIQKDYVFVGGSLTTETIDPDAEVISVFVTSSVTAELIAKMPKLRLIACRSTGYNNVDFPAVQARDIQVVNVPTYGENTVAEYTFALLLALTRKVPTTITAVASGNIQAPELAGHDLKGKTIAILGFGHIGQYTARIAKGFGMHVLGYDPYPNKKAADEIGVELVDFDTAVKQCHILSLHIPYSPENHHLINADVLSMMKRGSVIINTARGELIDTKALLVAKQSGQIGGLGLDVIEGEQLLNIQEELLLLRREKLPAEMLEMSMEINSLKKMPNVIITPHNAYNTVEAVSRINQTTAQNIVSFLEGKPTNVVKPPAKRTGKLLITRHGESEWNALGKWTGSTDVHLSEKGFREAAMLGQVVDGTKVDYAFTSQQIRALETLESILDASQQFDVPFERSDAINERDYGDYTGKNKWEMRDSIGEETFNRIRREWNFPVPNGETLKDVYARAVPFYTEKILPKVLDGQNVLVVSHGNAIRALMKYIEDISDADVAKLEMPFGEILVYEVDDKGKQLKKESRKIDTTPPPA